MEIMRRLLALAVCWVVLLAAPPNLSMSWGQETPAVAAPAEATAVPAEATAASAEATAEPAEVTADSAMMASVTVAVRSDPAEGSSQSAVLRTTAAALIRDTGGAATRWPESTTLWREAATR